MTPDDVAHMHKLMALFDADIEGERHAALAAANRFLGAKGVSWRDLAIIFSPKPVEIDGDYCDCEDCCRAAGKAIMAHADFATLSEKQQSFIVSINSAKWKDRAITEKQRVYVFALADRLRVDRRRKEAA